MSTNRNFMRSKIRCLNSIHFFNRQTLKMQCDNISFEFLLFFLCFLQISLCAANAEHNIFHDVGNRDNQRQNVDNYNQNTFLHNSKDNNNNKNNKQQQRQRQQTDDISFENYENLINDKDSSVGLLRFVNDNELNDVSAITNKEPITSTTKATTATTTTTTETKTNVIDSLETYIDIDSSSAVADEAVDDGMSLEHKVRLLTKQLNGLMTRQHENNDMLAHNLRKSLSITNDAANVDLDMRNELEQVRREVKSLRATDHLNDHKSRLTIEWLEQTISELRKQIVELQKVAIIKQQTQSQNGNENDTQTIRNDFQKLKSEIVTLKEQQQQYEVYVRELREEIMQQALHFKHLLLHNKQQVAKKQQQLDQQWSNEHEQDNKEYTNLKQLTDQEQHNCYIQSQQINELEFAQNKLKRELEEIKYSQIAERMRNIENEQNRLAVINANLSRQIATIENLRATTMKMLQDKEELQNKMDKSITELSGKITKLQFSNVELNAEQQFLRVASKNVANSLQVVRDLQNERGNIEQMQNNITRLQETVDRLQIFIVDTKRNKLKKHTHHKNIHNINLKNDISLNSKDANIVNVNGVSLVAKLENIEAQYTSIINKLPRDCSEAVTNNNNNKIDGLYIIAPFGQQRPLMAHCTSDGWTLIQCRYDGSADFNRTWEDYAQGFGQANGELWIGNEQLHHLTLNNCTSLRVVLQDIYNNTWYAEYKYFYISSRADGYRLHISNYSGNASDALNYQQGMQFSAIDVDRDISQSHCAADYEGGWWFSHCQHANLNGRYNLGLTWYDAAHNEWMAIKSSQMLIKRQLLAKCVDENTQQTNVHNAVATDTNSNSSSER